MKMTDGVLENYLGRTVVGKPAPSKEDLDKMESDFIRVLEEQEREDRKSYEFLYIKYGKKVVSRIEYCKKQQKQGNQDKSIKLLLSSFENVRRALKVLDKGLYSQNLAEDVRRGRHNVRRTATISTVLQPAVNEKESSMVEPQQTEPQQEEIEITKEKEHISINEPFSRLYYNKQIITEDQATKLFNALSDSGYIKETSREDFIYYYAQVGERAKNTLQWEKEESLLWVLMDELYPSGVKWREVKRIYPQFKNKKGLPQILSRAKRKDKYGRDKQSYKKHCATVKKWLTIEESKSG